MKKNLRHKIFFPLSILAIFISSCSCNSKKNYEVDVSNIKVELKTERFDKELVAIEHLSDSAAYAPVMQMHDKYGDFFRFYVQEILAMNLTTDTTHALTDSLVAFLQNPYYQRVFDTTVLVYNNLDDINAQFTEGFKHYQYYFPRAKTPTVVYYLNGPRAFTYGDTLLAIGLDNFLGENFWFYHAIQPPIPQFLVRRLRKEYIVPNAMQVMGTNLFPFIDNGKKMIDEMIYNGKIIYLLQHILPQTADSLLTGFSGTELKWLDDNESEVWKFYLKNNLLYETDPMVFKKYLNDAPNTSGMPAEAPGNTGSWVGWKIVQKFMNENPNYTLQGLMKEEDAQKILTLSKYKP
ncbi:MAG: hypothetical protein WCI97_06770 [Bacteroidota bacterium]